MNSSISKVTFLCRKNAFGANTVFLDKASLPGQNDKGGMASSWKYLAGMLFLNIPSVMGSGLFCEVEVLGKVEFV